MICSSQTAVAAQNCVPYYTEQPSDESLWCSGVFTRCDCVSISSSSPPLEGTELTLSEAERQLGRIVNQADLFGVSRTCRNSFISLYCYQIYTVHEEGTNGQVDTTTPSNQQVCPADCVRVITTDCDNDWTELSNVIGQFIESGAIQLPTLRQLEECGNPNTTMGGTGMGSCISLQPCKPLLEHGRYI